MLYYYSKYVHFTKQFEDWTGWNGCVLLKVVLVLLSLTPCKVTAQMVGCAVITTPVNFGTYNPGSGSPADAVGNVQITCTLLLGLNAPTSYQIHLNPGNSGSYAARQITSLGSHLNYNLYVDSAHTQVWGDASSGTTSVSDGYTLGLTPVTRNYPVYGRITASQDASPGIYGDVIIITVDY